MKYFLIAYAILLFACSLIQILACFSVFGREWAEQLLHPRNFPKGSALQRFADALRARFNPPTATERWTTSEPISPPRNYRLLSRLGSGDLCEVYRASTAGRDYAIKMPRHSESHPLLVEEQARLQGLLASATAEPYREYFPIPCEWARIDEKECSVFELRHGYQTARSIRRRYPQGLDGRHVAWMFNRVLEVLGFVHHQGWIHGAVLPPHLLFHSANHGLQLIGWTHSQPLGHALQFAPRRYKSWYPAECHRRGGATPATDIHLAAQSMIWMAGGDPLTGFIPDHIPLALSLLLLRCREPSSWRRPQDAWTLHAEFRELLEDVYGPPRFVHLHLS